MIPIALPFLGEDEAEAARAAVLSGWVSQGPLVTAFEREFAERVGAPHACAVSNCTTALHLALVALGVGPGDEVIVPSHSFIATANCIRYCGATPVFVDIGAETFNLDLLEVERAITPKTRGILAVHQMGMPCDLAGLTKLADTNGLWLVEDAACAAGAEIQIKGAWEPIGRPRGAAACFSFHPRKVITTGEGGMITTADPALDAQFRLLRQHGMSVPDTVRHGSPQVIFEDYALVGFNYRMTDIQAAIGRRQLRRLPELVERRRALAARYAQMLAGVEGLRLPVEPAWARSNWQSYCVRLPVDVNQRNVMQAMLDKGVATRRGIMCAHREPAYADRPAHARLQRSEAAQDHSIVLPLYAQMSHADQDKVVKALGGALRA